NFDVPAPAGPSVVASAPGGNILDAVSSVRVAFDEAMDAATFTSSKITSFTGSGGQFSIPITDVNPVNGSGGTQFDITFAKQTTLGIYTMVLGPDIRDLAGNPMDQDGDGIPGEVPGDSYTITFALHGLRILSSTPSTVLT